MTLSGNPFPVSAWRPVDGFDQTDITNHRHIADGKAQSTLPVAFDRLAAGGQPGVHLLYRHLAQDLRGREQLVRRSRQLPGAVGGACPRPGDRYPARTEGDRATFTAVAHRGPGLIMPALGASQAVTSASINSCITCRPAPTARASKPDLDQPLQGLLWSDQSKY